MKRQAILICLVLSTVCGAQDEPASSEPARAEGFEGLLSGVRDILDEIDAEKTSAAADLPLPGDPVSLSVRDVITMTLEQNPQVLRSAADVDVFLERVGQARAEYLPRVSVGGGFNYQEDAGAGFTDNFLSRLVAPDGLEVDEITRSERFTVEQLIFAGGTVRAAVNASISLAESEQWRRAVILDGLEFQAKRAYYDCLSARALVLVAEDSVKTFERHLRDTELILEVGDTSRYEVIRAETELRARQTSVTIARNQERIAYTILRRLLNLPQNTPLVLTDSMFWTPLGSNRDELTAFAKLNRPEIHALRHAIESGEQNVKQAKGAFWPKVAASAEWTNTDGAGSFVLDGWTANVGFEWDLYAGGKRKHARREARARTRSLEYQLAEVEAMIEEEVVQAHIQVQDAIARIGSENQSVTLATEGMRLSILRFQEGLGTQGDILDAQLALTNAQSDLVISLREYAVAHAALERATGRGWVGRDLDVSDFDE